MQKRKLVVTVTCCYLVILLGLTSFMKLAPDPIEKSLVLKSEYVSKLKSRTEAAYSSKSNTSQTIVLMIDEWINSTRDLVNESNAIIAGKVIKITDVNEDKNAAGYNTQLLQIKVDEDFKSSVNDQIIEAELLKGHVNEVNLDLISDGDTYIIFLDKDGENYRLHSYSFGFYEPAGRDKAYSVMDGYSLDLSILRKHIK